MTNANTSSLCQQLELEKIDLAPPSLFACASSGQTHVGRIRLVNEDAYLELSEQRLWAVADGMGGHKRGDYASKAVVEALQEFNRQDTLVDNIELIESQLLHANQRCQQAFRRNRVGSTIASLFEFGGYCFFLWAGDSRVYRLRNGELQQMTCDHSVAQEKLDKGELTHDEARSHASAHILTRAVGIHRQLRLQLCYEPAVAGDRYLLCSDGLYSGLSIQDIQEQLKKNTRDEALAHLVEGSLVGGGRDNITAIIVDMH